MGKHKLNMGVGARPGVVLPVIHIKELDLHTWEYESFLFRPS